MYQSQCWRAAPTSCGGRILDRSPGGTRQPSDTMMTPKEECEQIMNELMTIAEKLLKDQGTFLPFAAFMLENGETVWVGGEIEGTDMPSSTSLLRVLEEGLGLRVASGECKATGIAVDVMVRPPGHTEKMDAIRIHLDHRDHFSALVFFPYRLVAGGGVEYEKHYAQRGPGEMLGGPARLNCDRACRPFFSLASVAVRTPPAPPHSHESCWRVRGAGVTEG